MKKIMTGFLLLYLKLLAKIAIFISKPRIIGIGGSVGKSSLQKSIYASFKDCFPTYASYGNSETGVPLGILGIIPKDYSFSSWVNMCLRAPFGIGNLIGKKYLILEMGIDDPYPPKNMEYLLSIVSPNIAVSLNISGPHLMQFEKLLKFAPRSVRESPEKRREFILSEMGREDTKIITKSKCEVGIYNADDTNITKYMQEVTLSKLLTFGSSNKNSIYYKDYDVSPSGTSFEFAYERKTIKLFFEKIILPQDYQETFAAAILVSLEEGISIDKIEQSLPKNFVLPPGRSTLFEGVSNSTIIDSSYNASKKSILTFLDLCQILKKKTGQTITFLFGDMRELGLEAEIEHDEVMSKIADTVDYLYLVGELTKKYIFEKAENCENILEVKHFKNSAEAGKYLSKNLSKNTILLVKGSQNTIFLEEAIKYVLKNKEDENKLCRQESHWKKN